jgi:glutamate synthase domain-containing protein 3
MAGGELIVLGLGQSLDPIVGSYVGTGMHGGVIYIRGEVSSDQVGKEVGIARPEGSEQDRIDELVIDFCRVMDLDARGILLEPFSKLYPFSHRPYGKMYAP